jgi:hypothetical protein
LPVWCGDKVGEIIDDLAGCGEVGVNARGRVDKGWDEEVVQVTEGGAKSKDMAHVRDDVQAFGVRWHF